MVEAKQDLGLAVLTSSAVFGAWSAWNSSLFTAATFVDNEEKYRNAKMAMDLGLVTAIATGAGVHFVYHEKGRVAAIAAIATGVALYAAYYWKLRCNPNVSPYMMMGKKNPQILSTQPDNWVPLSNEEIARIKSINNTEPIHFVSEP